jgi:hypothetical protein
LFRLLPAQQVLLEGEVPVRLGSRALEILIALVELVSKNELMARVWPDTFVDEGSIKVLVTAVSMRFPHSYLMEGLEPIGRGLSNATKWLISANLASTVS